MQPQGHGTRVYSTSANNSTVKYRQKISLKVDIYGLRELHTLNYKIMCIYIFELCAIIFII